METRRRGAPAQQQRAGPLSSALHGLLLQVLWYTRVSKQLSYPLCRGLHASLVPLTP